MLSEDHVTFLHLKCILTKKEKEEIEKTKGAENRVRTHHAFESFVRMTFSKIQNLQVRTLLYTLTDKRDVYWAPVFLESLRRIPRAESCAAMVEGVSERPTFYSSEKPFQAEVNETKKWTSLFINS